MERIVFPHEKNLAITLVDAAHESRLTGIGISAGDVRDVPKSSIVIVHAPSGIKGLPDKDLVVDPSQTLSRLVKLNEGVHVEIPHINIGGVPFNKRIAVGRRRMIEAVEHRIAELSKKMGAGRLPYGSSEINELNKLRGLKPLL